MKKTTIIRERRTSINCIIKFIIEFDKKFMKKGISPIIGTVLLIAATMTIAGLLAFWASSFVQSQASYFSNQTQKIYCSSMEEKINIINCKYYKESGEIWMIVDNIGSYDLKGMSLIIFYNDTYVTTYKTNETISAGMPSTLTFKNVQNITGYNKMILRSLECPTVEVEVLECPTV